MMGEIVLNCLTDVAETVAAGDNPIPVVWAGDTSEPKCRQDKVFRCKKEGNHEVKCYVKIQKAGPMCTQSPVMVNLHGLCCFKGD